MGPKKNGMHTHVIYDRQMRYNRKERVYTQTHTHTHIHTHIYIYKRDKRGCAKVS